mgnify:FL=1
MLYSTSDLFDLGQTEHGDVFVGTEFPWDAIGRIATHVAGRLRPAQLHRGIGTSYISGNVFIGEGTVVEHGAMIVGPAIIGRNCRIGHNAHVRENALIGDHCTVGTGCEVKNCLLFNGVELPHFNFVGDSILGHRAHLGAGAVVANLKLSRDNVWIEMDGRCIDTGLRKLGALVGDGAEVGCNAVLNPGTILGKGSRVYPGLSWRGILPSNMIAKHRPGQEVVVSRPRGPIS